MSKRVLTALAILSIFSIEPPVGSAQILAGDLLVTGYSGASPPSSMGVYRGSGAFAWQVQNPATQYWTGAVALSSGDVAVARGAPVGVDIYDPGGALKRSFATPALGAKGPTDIDVLSDGVLVLSNYSGFLHFYTEFGVHVASHQVTLDNGKLAYGIAVDQQDHVWVGYWAASAGLVLEADRLGNVLSQFVPNLDISDLVVDPDGSLWLVSPWYNDVYHMTAAGSPIGQFSVPLPNSTHSGIALAPDGSLYHSTETGSQIVQTDKLGNLLNTFTLKNTGETRHIRSVSRTSAAPGCAGSGGIAPVLDQSGPAVAGASFSLFIGSGLGGASAYIAFGLSPAYMPLGASGCVLGVAPLLPLLLPVPLAGIGPGQGSGSVSGQIPLGSKGLTFSVQALVEEPTSVLGFSMSNSLELPVQ